MVRAPCCEKMGLKKGPWTPEEDQILINYIQHFGHGNWRALPKQAGLLRCGKSCRLRWINYLRPDIKRGNFTREEEDAIINLHEMLGNRWSVIAAKLPGRTDNEIKNVWHTHLKKRLKTNINNNNNNNFITPENKRRSNNIDVKQEQELANLSNQSMEYRPISPQQCSSSEVSSVITVDDTNDYSTNTTSSIKVESSEKFPEIDENFWSEVLSCDNSSLASNFPAVAALSESQISFSPVENVDDIESVQYLSNSTTYDSMDFWYNLLSGVEASLELPEI